MHAALPGLIMLQLDIQCPLKILQKCAQSPGVSQMTLCVTVHISLEKCPGSSSHVRVAMLGRTYQVTPVTLQGKGGATAPHLPLAFEAHVVIAESQSEFIMAFVFKFPWAAQLLGLVKDLSFITVKPGSALTKHGPSTEFELGGGACCAIDAIARTSAKIVAITETDNPILPFVSIIITFFYDKKLKVKKEKNYGSAQAILHRISSATQACLQAALSVPQNSSQDALKTVVHVF